MPDRAWGTKMELPKKPDNIVLEEELLPAKEVLDEEDTADLIYECYDLLSRIVERSNPNWLQTEWLQLMKKLEVALSWHKLH